jgi:hypothetical protein
VNEDIKYYYDLPNEKVLKEEAPILRRAGAFIIDLLVFNIFLYTPFIQSFQFISGINNKLLSYDYLLLNPELISIILGVLLASTIVFCFYMASCEYVFGKTIGKQFFNVWVEGSNNLWSFVFRNLLKSTLIFLLPFDLLGLLIFKQRLIDKLLGVNVLYINRIKLIEGFV